MPLKIGTTNIGAIYKGTTPIVAIYKGTTLVFSAYTWQEWLTQNIYNALVPQTLPLPSEYQQVEYIESSGTQYIDTGFKPNNNTTFSLTFQISSTTTTQGIFGVGDSSLSKSYRLGMSASGYFYFAKRGTQFNGASNSSNTSKNTFELKNNKVYLNGSEYITITDTDTYQCENNAYIFFFGGSTTITKASGKLYSCKIYDNSVLVRNFIPCYRKSDNVIGLYDLVNGTFYTNAGTGTFTKGANVNHDVKDKAKVVEISGNSVVENQNAYNGNFESQVGWEPNSGVGNFSTISVANNILTQTYNSTPDASYKSGIITATSYRFNIIQGHYYLISYYAKSTKASNLRAYTEGTGYFTNVSISANQWTRFTGIKQATTNKTNDYLVACISDGTIYGNGDTLEFQKVMIIDITQMFPFDTPATLTDTRVQAILNRGYIAYNTGELKNVDIGVISSECFNIWDEQTENGRIDITNGALVNDNDRIRSVNYIELVSGTTYYTKAPNTISLFYYDSNYNYIDYLNVQNQTFTPPSNAKYLKFFISQSYGTTYNHDICINVSSSLNGTYKAHTTLSPITFKYQGGGVNTSKDKMTIGKENVVFVKDRVEVSLNSVGTWTYDSTHTRFYSPELATKYKTPSDNNTKANMLCPKYELLAQQVLFDGTQDKTISYSSNGRISIRDTSLNGDTSLISGVVQMQLATPQTITIPRKHLAVIDLGSLNWSRHSTDVNRFVSYNNIGAKQPQSYSTLPNIYCSLYTAKSNQDVVSTNNDMVIGLTDSTSTFAIVVRNSNYTNATDFKTAMQGIYLFYETENEVADITDTIDIQSGGSVNANWFSWVKNQLVQNGNFADSSKWSNTTGSISVSNNIGTFTKNSSSEMFIYQSNSDIPTVLNHKYLVIANVKSSVSSTIRFVCDNNYSNNINVSTTKTLVSAILEPTSRSAFRFAIRDNNSLSANDTLELSNVMLIDITVGFPTDTPTSINDPRIQEILRLGYIPTDTTGTFTLVDTQVLPDIKWGIKCK